MAFRLNLGVLQVAIGADTSDLGRAEKEVKRTSKSMGTSFKALAGIISTVIAGVAVRNTILLADKMNMLDLQIKNVTKNAKSFDKIRDAIRSIASETGASITSVSNLSQALIIAGESIDATDDQVTDMVSNLNKLGIIGGTSGEAMSNSMRQFGQAMAGGVVRAEEFNSIIENTPLIAKSIADAMGKNTGELRKMVIEGKVLSKDVFDALLKQTDDINKKFADMPITIDRASGMMANSFAMAMQELDKATGITSEIAENIQKASDFILEFVKDSEKVNAVLDNAATAAQLIATIMLARLAPSILKVGANVIGVARSMASLTTTAVITSKSIDMYGASTVRSSVATKTLSLRAKGAAIAMGGLRKVMALLGGPLGLIIAAATSLAFYSVKAQDSSKSTKALNDRIKELTQSAEEFRREKFDETIGEVEANLKMLTLRREYLGLQVGEKARTQLKGVNDEIAIMNAQLTALKAKRDAIGTSVTDPVAPDAVTAITPDGVEGAVTGTEAEAEAEIDALIAAQQEKEAMILEANQREAQMLTEHFATRLEMIETQAKAEHEAILRNTVLTEEEKTKLLKRSAENRNAQLISIERQSQSMQMSVLQQGIGQLQDMLKAAGKEDTAIAKVAFVAQKALAIGQSIIATQVGAAKALAMGPAGVPLAKMIEVMGAINTGIIAGTAIAGAGRQFGGTATAGLPIPINEGGSPEMFTNNAGRQFLLPDRSGKISPLNSGSGGGSGGINLIVNNNAAGVEVIPTMSDGQIMLEINKAKQDAVDQVNSSLASGRGDTSESLRQGFTQQRNI